MRPVRTRRARRRRWRQWPESVCEWTTWGSLLLCSMPRGEGRAHPGDARMNRACARREHSGNFDARLSQRSEEHTSELQSLMRISYAVFCLKKKKQDCFQPDIQIKSINITNLVDNIK